MKIFNGTVWAYGLMGLMTLAFALFVTIGSALTEDISKASGTEIGPTILFAHTGAARVWSILAVASLIGNMVWGRWRAKRTDLPVPHQLPMFCHLVGILTMTFIHLIGVWLTVFKMGETI